MNCERIDLDLAYNTVGVQTAAGSGASVAFGRKNRKHIYQREVEKSPQ